ncbi:YcaO-like family protein [Type-D symbiont of Plautia stali]|uniref:YcaO-like family protein n=1 Tax=Type-D symbiont of Plautia stali TaxID=1560356 RepID=UPI00073F75AD|nr:YcaO-like family protein [Type-D symbiont of Plautia stali]
MLGPKINRVTVDLPANLVFPKMIRAHLEMGTTSCATGYDRNILKRSLGEALERHISFSDADTGGPDLTLSEMDPFIAEWFQRYCRMNIGEYPSLSHRFTTTEVTDLSTEKKYFAPLIAFNLGKSQDEEIFGYRDSSGTALHQSHTMAFTGSRDEFCERQSLTLFWYFGHCLSSIELSKKN